MPGREIRSTGFFNLTQFSIGIFLATIFVTHYVACSFISCRPPIFNTIEAYYSFDLIDIHVTNEIDG